jgi:hypothetical protein
MPSTWRLPIHIHSTRVGKPEYHGIQGQDERKPRNRNPKFSRTEQHAVAGVGLPVQRSHRFSTAKERGLKIWGIPEVLVPAYSRREHRT